MDNSTSSGFKLDEEIIKNLPEDYESLPKLSVISERDIRELTGYSDLSCLTVLNLHGSNLSRLTSFKNCTSLKKLILSFNDLSRIDEINNLNIEYLDVSFNRIGTLEGLKTLHQLLTLNVSWNRLRNSREDISILRKHCEALTHLDLRYNPWQKEETVRFRAIGRLRNLIILNGKEVKDDERKLAFQAAAASRINQQLLLRTGRMDEAVPKSLRLQSCCHILHDLGKPIESTGTNDQWLSFITSLNMDGQHISKLSNLERLENLKWASFNDNDLTKIEGLENCILLEELCLNFNCLTKLENLGHLKNLKHLELSHNYIFSMESTHGLSSLQYLSADNNKLVNLHGLQRLTELKHLYLGSNKIDSGRELFKLKLLNNLTVLDLMGNPIVKLVDNYRLFIVYHLKNLRALDGKAVEIIEANAAKDEFGGKLTQDIVVERLGHSNFIELKELEVANSNFKQIDLGNANNFINLKSINLEHNNLINLNGLINLPNIKVICLNYNKIESILPTQKPSKYQSKVQPQPPLENDTDDKPILPTLEVLHLGYNGIKDLALLGLNKIPSLKSVFLQGNEISKVCGIENLTNLRSLVLDRNRIKSLNESSLISQWKLNELHMDDNRLKDLSHFGNLQHLQRLFLANNRISEIVELDKLEPLLNLVEISLINNPCARRHLHRPALVYRVPSLHVIDGITINDEERAKADIYFLDQVNASPSNNQVSTHATFDATLPGIGSFKMHVPVKVVVSF